MAPDSATDRRVRLRNMQLVELFSPDDYVPNSSIAQFVSTNDNIGNYMPVLAIQEMLGEVTDCWNIHRKIDWDFVNRNYKYAVIGGAGLLHKTFSTFWQEFDTHCKLPFVIWGVGVCDIDGASSKTYCDPEFVIPVFQKALAINVRDELTASLYGLGSKDIDISPCPTVYYLKDFEAQPRRRTALLAQHPDLVSDNDHARIQAKLEQAGFVVYTTLNVQMPDLGLVDLIEKFYVPAELVVTSRLHGAITAYALGVPYIAVAGDSKLREFHRLFGGGQLVEKVDSLEDALGQVERPRQRPGHKTISQFAKRVIALLNEPSNK